MPCGTLLTVGRSPGVLKCRITSVGWCQCASRTLNSSWHTNRERVYLNQVMLEIGRFSIFFVLVWQLQNQMLWFSWWIHRFVALGKVWSSRLRIDSLLRLNPPHVQIQVEGGCFSLGWMRSVVSTCRVRVLCIAFFSLMRLQIGLRPVPFALPHSSKKQQMAGSMHRLLTWLRVRLMRKSLNVSFVQFWLTHQIGGLVNALPLKSKNRRNKYRFFFPKMFFVDVPSG